MSALRIGLLLLNAVPLGASLYLAVRLYGNQVDLALLSARNAGYFAALVLLSIAGYTNTIWRYIMALKHEHARIDERALSERLMYINLISFFLPFGVLNYAAQLALVYRSNPPALVARAFAHDKLVFLGVIALCFGFSFAGFTPALAARLGVSSDLTRWAFWLVMMGLAVLGAYLAWHRYLRFFLVQLAVFAAINMTIAALLAAYTGGGQGFALTLQKLFAYSAAVILPVSLGGVGPREAILLFAVDAPGLRAAILAFCVLWFLAMVTAAFMLFVFKRQASAWAASQYLRWRRSPPAANPVDTIGPPAIPSGDNGS